MDDKADAATWAAVSELVMQAWKTLADAASVQSTPDAIAVGRSLELLRKARHLHAVRRPKGYADAPFTFDLVDHLVGFVAREFVGRFGSLTE